jgi:putative DNA primase/helicase
LSLRRRWLRWANDRLDVVRDYAPLIPNALENRLIDNWTPLLTIAELMGGVWPDKARAAALELSGGRASDEDSDDTRLLSDIQTIFTTTCADKDFLSSDEIIAGLKTLQDRGWADLNRGRGLTPIQLATRLRGFGSDGRKLTTVKTRLGPKATGQRWHRKDFTDAWARYTPVKPEQAEQPNDSGPQRKNSDPEQAPIVPGSEPAISPMNTGPVPAVPGSGPNSDPYAGDADVIAL